DRDRLLEVDRDDLVVTIRIAKIGAGAGPAVRTAVLNGAARDAGGIRVLSGADTEYRRVCHRVAREAHARHLDHDLIALARAKSVGDLRSVAVRTGAGEKGRRACDRTGCRSVAARRRGRRGRRRKDVAEVRALALIVGENPGAPVAFLIRYDERVLD